MQYIALRSLRSAAGQAPQGMGGFMVVTVDIGDTKWDILQILMAHAVFTEMPLKALLEDPRRVADCITLSLSSRSAGRPFDHSIVEIVVRCIPLM